MPSKRYALPEVLLQRVIRSLEQSDRENHRSHRAAVLALLSEGPLMCSETLLREIESPDPGVSLIRAELIAFLRQTVRLADQGGLFGYPISLAEVRLFATAAGRRVIGAAEGSVRDMAVLQLFLLMQSVGLRNVRMCGAAEPGGCQRIFVKTYRRTFCSMRCQKRAQARRLRRKQLEQQIRARRRRITKGTL
jgi:CGNR zinc finger